MRWYAWSECISFGLSTPSQIRSVGKLVLETTTSQGYIFCVPFAAAWLELLISLILSGKVFLTLAHYLCRTHLLFLQTKTMELPKIIVPTYPFNLNNGLTNWKKSKMLSDVSEYYLIYYLFFSVVNLKTKTAENPRTFQPPASVILVEISERFIHIYLTYTRECCWYHSENLSGRCPNNSAGFLAHIWGRITRRKTQNASNEWKKNKKWRINHLFTIHLYYHFLFLMRSIKIRPHELQLDKCAVRDLGVIGA